LAQLTAELSQVEREYAAAEKKKAAAEQQAVEAKKKEQAAKDAYTRDCESVRRTIEDPESGEVYGQSSDPVCSTP